MGITHETKQPKLKRIKPGFPLNASRPSGYLSLSTSYCSLKGNSKFLTDSALMQTRAVGSNIYVAHTRLSAVQTAIKSLGLETMYKSEGLYSSTTRIIIFENSSYMQELKSGSMQTLVIE